MIWRQVKSLANFHAQALNIPIEVQQESPGIFTQSDPDLVQVVFRENAEQPVKVVDFALTIGYELNEENLEVITQALDDYLPGLAHKFHKQKRDQLKKLVLSGVEERKRSLKEAISQSDYTLSNLNRQIFELTRTRNIDQHVLNQLNYPSLPLSKKIVNEYQHVKKLVPGMYQSINCDDRYLRTKTHQVNIIYDDQEYKIGELTIELDLLDGIVKIFNSNNSVNDYPHPHVNNSNEVCLGNITSGLRQMLGEYELYGALELLHKFVHQYNEDDAYQKIQYWNDPDYCEEDDEYVRCRESGSYGRTCLDCGDSYCPYYENALNECIENICFENCVTCRDRCDPGLELLQDCHDENPLNCMTCRFHTCMFYKDYDGCHDVNEELCSTCEIADCKYQGVVNE